MALIAHLADPAVTVIDHNKYLIGIYKELEYVPKDIFNVQTPFRMDLEAEKVAQAMEHVNDIAHKVSKRNRKKRKQFMQYSTNNLKDQEDTNDCLTKALVSIKNLHPKYFSEPPSIEIIRENNRSVRELVKNLSSYSSHVYCPIKGENTSIDKAEIIEIAGNFFVALYYRF